jgi:hypothetical protein
MMKILIRGQKDKVWHLVESAAYGKEAELQHLLAESPSLISLDEVRPKAGALLFAVQEFNLPIGSIDLLAFTAGGDIAIIECKLASNQEIKRKVIGQVLEYGAHLWGMRYEELDAGVRMRTGENLAEQIEKLVDSPDWDEEEFRSIIDTALVSGNFMLIIVVDEIDDELSRIVQFINACGNPSFEFAALEMRRFQAENSEMLVPRVFGPVRSSKANPNLIPTKQWEEGTYFDELIQRNGEGVAKVARQILDWSNRNVQVWWGHGSRTGSFVPYFDHNGTRNQMMAVYTYGSVEIYFYWMSHKPPFDAEEKRFELMTKLNQIPGVNIPREAIGRRPSIKLSVLEQNNGTQQFISVFDWVLQEIKAS